MAGTDNNARDAVARLREDVDQLELEIFELRNKLASKKEDLDIASDVLVNDLQMLKSVQARSALERSQLDDLPDDTEDAPGDDSMALDRLLHLARRPWESSELDMDASGRGTEAFKRATVAQLGKLAASMNALRSKLEDPFVAERRETARASAAKRLAGASDPDRADSVQAKIEQVDVVRDEGDRAVVSVRLVDGQTFASLLEYVAEYWSLNSGNYSLFDASGMCWPLHAPAKETLVAAQERIIYLRRSDAALEEEDDEEQGPTSEDTAARLKDIQSSHAERQQVAQGQPGQELASAASAAGGGTDSAKGVRFRAPGARVGTRSGRSELETEMDRAELESNFRRGYTYSLKIVRFHCETFLFLLLLTLVFNYAYFVDGSYDSQPIATAVELAFFETPFSPCTRCAADAGAVDKMADVAFGGITSEAGMYSFLDGPVKELLTLTEEEVNATGPVYSRHPVVQEYNVLAGSPQLQQLRVDPTCTAAEVFGLSFGPCIPTFVEGTASEADFATGPAATDIVAKAFSFSPPTSSAWPGFVRGSVAAVGDQFRVDKGGFVLGLNTSREVFEAQIDALVAGSWVDASARAVFLTFNLYNPNLDVFLVCDLVFQFTTSNGVVPFFRLYPVRLSDGFGPNDRVEQGLLFAALALYLLFMILFVWDLFHAKSTIAFLRRPRVLVDLSLLVLIVVTAAFAVDTSKIAGQLAAEVAAGAGSPDAEYVELRGVAMARDTIRALQACIGILLVLKAIGYLTMNPQVSLIGISFTKSLGLINNFAFVFLAFLFAFAMTAHFTIGRDEFAFAGFDLALFSTAQLMLGNFRFSSLSNLSITRIWPVIFSSVVFFFGFFGLYRVFFAIIAFSYSRSMDRVRRLGFFWLPSVNLEYRIHAPADSKTLRKLQVATKFGIEPGPPATSR